MISQDLKHYKLPDKSGVYFFYQEEELLYIGKATSLKDRVKSYFVGGLERGPKIWRMIEIADRVEWQETDSVLEALLLETELIKKHQPKYNSREKDDKSYWYVVITDEDYPRIFPVRGRELQSPKNPYCAISNLVQFGPFPYASEIKEALKIIRRIFPYRDKCSPCVTLVKKDEPCKLRKKAKGGGTLSEPTVVPRLACKACFNRQLGLCPGVCTGEISKTDYRKTIRNIKLLFAGQKQEIIKNLQREMKNFSKKQEFEKAGKIRDQIFALKHIRDVSLLKNVNEKGTIRLEAYDIAHLAGKATVGAMAVWQGSELDRSGQRLFILKGEAAEQINDPANLQEIMERRLAHREWPKPDVIVLDGNQVQIKSVEQMIKTAWPDSPPVLVAVTKDERHRASRLLGETKIIRDYHQAIVAVNAEAHRLALSYHQKKMRQKFVL